MRNEAAERLLNASMRVGPARHKDPSLEVLLDAALAAERKATVERIRKAVDDLYGGIPEEEGDYAIGYDDAKYKVFAILDAEAARD